MNQLSNTTSERMNLLWQKSQGDIANLSLEEKQELVKLLSDNTKSELKQKISHFYPRHTLLGGLLLESAHQQRMTQQRLAKKLGMSVYHLNKIITGTANVGMRTAKTLHQTLHIDGNILVEWS